jgi:hypothetical protein
MRSADPAIDAVALVVLRDVHVVARTIDDVPRT